MQFFFLRAGQMQEGWIKWQKKSSAVWKGWPRKCLSLHITYPLQFGNILRSRVGIAAQHCWVLACSKQMVSAPEELPSCVNVYVKGGRCQTAWSRLRETHAMVFGFSRRRTNKLFYISAFSHERAGAIFTREQRTCLCLTCCTVSTALCKLQHQKLKMPPHSGAEKLLLTAQVVGKVKTQLIWPMTISRSLSKEKKRRSVSFSSCWMQNTPCPLPFFYGKGWAPAIRDWMRNGAEEDYHHTEEWGKTKKKKKRELKTQRVSVNLCILCERAASSGLDFCLLCLDGEHFRPGEPQGWAQLTKSWGRACRLGIARCLCYRDKSGWDVWHQGENATPRRWWQEGREECAKRGVATLF